ncbi:DnaJ domain protein [Cryptosporidium meleagridis]|uniref:DnaJ domain protein n=1 Tax=Cryptosporidium meleagridis TaxID=93969 RepID=A0A2P4YWD1_9CRYT|nr:DnaJ domain protein [Cryptosporidium meleagridis]
MDSIFYRFQTAFKLLGLEVGASTKEIKSAFRNLAKKVHPDKNRGKYEKSAHESFTKLRDSYVLLCNEVERKRFEKEYLSLNDSNKPQQKGRQNSYFNRSLAVNTPKTDGLLKKGRRDGMDLESLRRESMHLVNAFREYFEPKVVKKYNKQNLRWALNHMRVDKIVDRFSEFEKIVLFKLAQILTKNL